MINKTSYAICYIIHLVIPKRTLGFLRRIVINDYVVYRNKENETYLSKNG